MIIGLTGGIASGKSTVANMFKDIGIPVIDADIIARVVVEPNEEAYEQIVAHFGITILNDDGTIDRKKLGAIIFNNEKERKKLNEIVHPAVRKMMKAKIQQYKQAGHKTIVLDIPLLFESKLTSLVEKTIVVFVDEDIQHKRLRARDSFTDEEAKARISSQMPLIEKKALADAVIENHGSIAHTSEQLKKILNNWNCL